MIGTRRKGTVGQLKSDFHCVLGSGFGSALDQGFVQNLKGWRRSDVVKFSDVDGIHKATVQGHKGVFEFFIHEATGKRVCFQVGRLHGYEGLPPRQAVAPVLIARAQGTENFILTNAAGGLNAKFQVGSVMIIKDHVNLTGSNPLVGPNPTHPDHPKKEWGPRFPDLKDCYDPEWRRGLKEAFSKTSLIQHEGVYLGLLGPSFETPAEVRLFSSWGLDAVGMSTVWEALALKHTGARICGLSLISNAACGLGDSNEDLDHETILEASQKSAGEIVKGLFGFFEREFSNV